MLPACLIHFCEANVILTPLDCLSTSHLRMFFQSGHRQCTECHAHVMQIYTDAALAKINFRWRTALIVRPSCWLPYCTSLTEPAFL